MENKQTIELINCSVVCVLCLNICCLDLLKCEDFSINSFPVPLRVLWLFSCARLVQWCFGLNTNISIPAGIMFTILANFYIVNIKHN